MQKPRRKIQADPGYRRILWPTDFSRLANAVLSQAARLATRSGAQLLVLHVLSPPAIYAVPDLSGIAWDQLERESRAAAQARLARLTNHVKARLPRTRVQGVLAEGNPATEILRAAKRLKCDLILIATHGHSGLAHLLIGGVAERVVRTAPCPVLTVRHPAMRVKRA